MPQSLAEFGGANVEMVCYRGCKDSVATVQLKAEKVRVDPSFVQSGGVGEMRWDSGSEVKCFKISATLDGATPGSGHYQCPKCRASSTRVYIVSSSDGKKPLIFGYMPPKPE